MAKPYAPQNINSDQLVISVKEARKLLGKAGYQLNNNQIIELVTNLTSMADDFLQDLGSTNYTGK